MCLYNHGCKALWVQDISKFNQEAVNMGWNIQNKTLNWPKIRRDFSTLPPASLKITQNSSLPAISNLAQPFTLYF